MFLRVFDMYCKFYGLKEKPFNVTSDPAFFYLSKQHKEALAHLSYGISQRKGILALTGEIGTGKTTLCRFFLSQLGSSIKTALILNTYFSELELLEAIVTDFGIRVKEKTKVSFIGGLNKFLLKESESGNNVALIIDEAQNLTAKQLEQVRLLSNLETEKHKLIQIVLAGQPELNRKLGFYNLRQLRQRVMVSYHINPLPQEELINYIEYRLGIAGSYGKVKFSDEALRSIWEFSHGTPRLINIICDRALLAGFVAETGMITLGIMDKCLNELSGTGLAVN